MGALSALVGRVPVLLQVQALALALAGVVALALSMGTDAQRYERVAFALPAAQTPSVSWDEERAAFADRMTRAFDIHPAVAGEFAEWILEAANRQELEPELVASLVLAESSFRKHARSRVGAIGPAQVRGEFWRSFCGGDLREPADNIYCGAQILASFRDQCGELRCALHSYNLGPTGARLASWERAGVRYVEKIENGLARFEGLAMM